MAGRNNEAAKISAEIVAYGERLLGNGLKRAIAAKKRCEDHNMEFEVGVFEEAIQRFRKELSDLGLDPDEVVKKEIESLPEVKAMEDKYKGVLDSNPR